RSSDLGGRFEARGRVAGTLERLQHKAQRFSSTPRVQNPAGESEKITRLCRGDNLPVGGRGSGASRAEPLPAYTERGSASDGRAVVDESPLHRGTRRPGARGLRDGSHSGDVGGGWIRRAP